MTFTFDTLFYTDYYGIRWADTGTIRTVTWSTVSDTLNLAHPNGETAAVVADPTPYLGIFARAFELWDAALDSVTFQMTDTGNAADVALAITNLDGPGGVDGWWTASWQNGRFTAATIQFDPFGISNGDLLTTALHEIGNILGLGDIRPSNSLRSVMEDPFPESFSGDTLWDDDIEIIRSYYGELSPLSGPRQIGTPGDDVLHGTPGNDRLDGAVGNDTLYGGDATDTLIGGDGDDFIFGGASVSDLADMIFAGDGNDSLDGGYGNDDLHGGDGNDTMLGGVGGDTLIGNAGDDVLTGSSHSDALFGGPGDDFINGGWGHDRLNGGSGADKFFHIGVLQHGSDWIQDYNAAEGDVLVFAGGAASVDDFMVIRAGTYGAGHDDIDELFVVHRTNTSPIRWALVDGDAQAQINIQINGQVYDLLA